MSCWPRSESLLCELGARLCGDEPLANGLLEIDARQVAEWLADYRRQHEASKKT